MSIAPEMARTWLDVDLTALLTNARLISTISGTRLLPMVKANGYGLGARAVAQALEPLDPWGYGVATAEEGAELRAHGISRPILVFTPLAPTDIPALLAHELRPSISDRTALEAWLASSAAPFHIEVDSGMRRAGFVPEDTGSWRELATAASGWEGVFTHFHSADSDAASVDDQWGRFCEVVASLPRRPPLIHAANSAAALLSRRYTADLIRPGIFMYGAGGGHPQPATVARLRSRVVAVRTVRSGESVSYGATWRAPADTVVATLGIGYADGVPRSLGNRGQVSLNGSVVPIIGRVTMDMTMVQARPGCVPGQVATIYGDEVRVDAQAEAAGTIPYELLTRISPRVPRRYSALS